MGLAGDGGEDDSRRRAGRTDRGQGAPHDGLQRLDAQALVEALELIARPDLTDQASERRSNIEHKALKAQTQQRLGERAAQHFGLARANQRQELADIGRGDARCGGLRRCGRRRQTLLAAKQQQGMHRQMDQFAGSMAGVHQPAQHPQLVDLVDRVKSLAESITPGVGKAVAALPHPQRIFGQAGIALDRGNRPWRKLDSIGVSHSTCIVLDIH